MCALCVLYVYPYVSDHTQVKDVSSKQNDLRGWVVLGTLVAGGWGQPVVLLQNSILGEIYFG